MNLKSPAHVLVLLMSLLLLGYTFYKALYSSFTHDESVTWLHYIHLPVSDIIFFTTDPSPNNHVLNTLMMKASQSVFGNHEWSLRLPNLLAYMFFLIYSIRWLRETKNNLLMVSGMIVFHANAYLLDFFSIARGYGLSVGFIFISFFYLRRFFSAGKMADAWLSIVAGALAVWSNFTGIHYYFALLLMYMVFSAGDFLSGKADPQKRTGKLLIRIMPVVIISYVLFRLIIVPLELLSKQSLIGSSDGFYQDTVRSIVFYSFLYDRYGLNLVTRFSWFAIASLVISAFLYCYHLVKMKFNAARSSNLLLVMLIIFTALSTQAQHYLYGTPFLQNRTALLFIVLFNCSYMLLYQFVSDHQSKYRMAMHTLFLIYPVFLAVMFVYNLRPHYYFDWKYDCSTKEMLTDLKNDSDLHSTDQKISLGISWLFEPGIKYYMNTRQLDWMKPANREGYDGTFDYYYIMDDRAFIENRKLTVVKDYRDSNSTLARRPEK